MLLDCMPPAEVIVIPAPAPTLGQAGLNFLLTPFQPLREQFTAITGIGLETDEAWDSAPGAAPRRVVLPARGDQPPLAYLAAGRPGGRRIVFLHGSPGVAEEWAAFLTETPADSYVLAVDRPGFADSGDEPVVELAAQAAAVAPLLSTEDGSEAIVVGYSYGGAVALRVAVDFPDRVAGLLLIASAADPTQEEIHPLQELAALEFFEALLPRELANANAELLALRPELEELALSLDQIRVPVTVVQGLSDTLVPPENAVYIREKLSSASAMRVVLVEEADHFLPWTHTDLLKTALGCVIGDIAGQSPSDR